MEMYSESRSPLKRNISKRSFIHATFLSVCFNAYSFFLRWVTSETRMDKARAAFGFLAKCYNKAKLKDAHKE